MLMFNLILQPKIVKLLYAKLHLRQCLVMKIAFWKTLFTIIKLFA